MVRIIIGLILVLFDLNLGVENVILGLFPDFIGYIFIFFGMRSVENHAKSYKRYKMFMIPSIILTYALYMGNLYGVILSWPEIVSMTITAFTIILKTVTTYILVIGIKEIENNSANKIGGMRMEYIWRVYALCSFFLIVAQVLAVGPMYLLMALSIAISGIVFIVYTSQTAIIYSELKRNNRL